MTLLDKVVEVGPTVPEEHGTQCLQHAGLKMRTTYHRVSDVYSEASIMVSS